MPNHAWTYQPGLEVLWPVQFGVKAVLSQFPMAGFLNKRKKAGGRVRAPEGDLAVRMGCIRLPGFEKLTYNPVSMESAKKEREKVEAWMVEVSEREMGPFRVTWDKQRWSEGVVIWEEERELFLALRELGYSILPCVVRLPEGQGVRLERRGRVELLVEEESFSEGEMAPPEGDEGEKKEEEI